jgi:hypothetical protein
MAKLQREPITTVSETTDPTLAEISPAYAELQAKFETLVAREAALQARLGPLKKVYEKSGHGVSNVLRANDEPAPPQSVATRPRVATLLGKFSPAPHLVAVPKEPAVAAEMRELTLELAATIDAIRLIRPLLTRAHLDASADLCALLMPRYRAIARRITSALVELGEADLAHRAFMHQHRSAARSTLRPVVTNFLGDPLDPYSDLRRALSWAIECGHFDPEDLPVAWRPAQSPAGAVRSWPGPAR